MLVGQERISLSANSARPSDLERTCLRLGQPETRGEAISALRRAGQPAVPLLVAVAERGDAASLPALRVLGDLGAVARSAVPALRRLAAAHGPGAAAAGEAIAAIGERDSIVLADWNGGHVIEVDADGKELRRVAIEKPWSVQPIAGDRLLVGCFTARRVVELGWDGKVEREFAVPAGPMLARRLVDGRTMIGSEGRVQVLDPAWQESSAVETGGRQFTVLDDDSLLLLGPGELGFRNVTATGEVVSKIAVPGAAMGFHRDGTGLLAVVNDATGQVIDATGQELRKLPTGGWCVQVLPDGRMVIAGANGVAMFGADGAESWRFKDVQVGHLAARITSNGR